MAKRIALFLLGLAVVLGVFLFYQYVSGPEVPAKKGTVGTTSGPTTLPMAYESRDENGVLEYVITASESPQPIKGQDGKPLPGQYLMQKPLATFYDRTGRIIQVRADECRVVIEQGPKNAGGGLGNLGGTAGSKVTDKLVIREGALKGNVRMTIGPRPGWTPAADAGTKPATATAVGAKPEDLLASGIRIYMDDELHLDGIQEVLKTAGGIHVRGERIGFDGQGLQLVFNRKEQRIEYLQIAKGNEVIIRGVGQKTLALGGQAVATSQPGAPGTAPLRAVTINPIGSTVPATLAGAATTQASTQAAASKPKVPPTTYRLSFGQDVTASVAQSKLTSDHLYVIFMGGSALGDIGSDIGAAGPGGAPTSKPVVAAGAGGIPAAAVPLGEVPVVPEPIAPAKADDLVIRWTGPMEVRPADEKDVKLVDGKDVALEAVGTATKPVDLTDARFHVQAGRLWYHGAEQRIMLEPEAFGRVMLEDPNRGSVQCVAASIDQKNNKAILNGPGTLVAKSGGSQTQVSWMTHMDIDLESTADANDPKKTTFAVRRAVIFGAAVKSDVLDFTADNLDMLIANVMDKGKQVPAMEHLVATGNVIAQSFRRPTAGMGGAAPVPQGGIQTRRMEITTAKAAGSNMPVPAQMLAEGDVTAWRWSDKSKGLTITDPAQGMQKETITAPRLIAMLAPKARPATEPAPATGRGAATAPADSGFASMGQNFDVTRFLASDGAKVVITPPPASKSAAIVATAQTLDASPDKGTATLASAEGGAPVRVAIGENAIEGKTVLLDQNSKTFQVPGAGVFHLTLPADGKTRKAPVPMVVTWQDSMNYDDVKHLATFVGKPVARMLPEAGALDQSDQARLTCEKTLLVQLKPGTAPATGSRPATGPAVAAGEGGNLAAFGNTSLVLDWMEAEGKVEAFGAQVGPDNKLLTRLRLSAIDPSATVPAKLRYSDAEHAIVVNGPGAMVVENFRPEKAGEQVSASGESDFIWTGGLRYDEAAGTIAFTSASAREADLVKFFFFPTKPFKFSGNMPGGATTASAAAGPRAPDYVQLQTQQLVATLAKSKDAAGKTIESPIGLGSAGNQDLSKVEATGGAQFDVGTYQVAGGQKAMTLSYHLAGDSMSFDVPTNIAYMNGTANEPAVAEQPSTGRRVSGRRIKLDMTKEKFYFEVEGIQGNLNGFGQ